MLYVVTAGHPSYFLRYDQTDGSWRRLDSPGRVLCMLAFHDRLWVGTSQKGVYCSYDDGASWVQYRLKRSPY